MQLDNQDRNTLLAALMFYHRAEQGDPDMRDEQIHALATGEDPRIGREDVSLDQAGIMDLFTRVLNSQTITLNLPPDDNWV